MDVLIIHNYSRIAQYPFDAKAYIEWLNDHGVTVESVNEIGTGDFTEEWVYQSYDLLDHISDILCEYPNWRKQGKPIRYYPQSNL